MVFKWYEANGYHLPSDFPLKYLASWRTFLRNHPSLSIFSMMAFSPWANEICQNAAFSFVISGTSCTLTFYVKATLICMKLYMQTKVFQIRKWMNEELCSSVKVTVKTNWRQKKLMGRPRPHVSTFSLRIGLPSTRVRWIRSRDTLSIVDMLENAVFLWTVETELF